MNNIIELVNEYRKRNKNFCGVIIVFGSEIQDWINELGDPQHWAPGCIAVDNDNNIYKAVGGDIYDGAERWQKI